MNEKTIQIKKQLIELKKEIEEHKNSEALEQYINAMALFHHYSFYNCVLIASQCPKATRVAGFRTWQKMNRFVRKGEKGIAILAPCINRKKNNELGPDDSSIIVNPVENKSKVKEMMFFRAVHVFDISQTEGQELLDGISQLRISKSIFLTSLLKVLRRITFRLNM